MKSGDAPEPAVDPRRPLGVWIMSVINLLVSGVVPVVAAYLFTFEVGSGLPILPHALLVLFYGGFGVGVIRATVRAWHGNDHSRQVLLTLLVIYHMLNIVINSTALLLRGVVSQPALRWSVAVVQPAFWIGINVWYFQRRQTLEWYEAMEALSK